MQRSGWAPSIATESRAAHLTRHTSDRSNRRGHPAQPTPPPPADFAVVRSPSPIWEPTWETLSVSSTRSAADIATWTSATSNADSGTFDSSRTAAQASGGCEVTHVTRRGFLDERDEEGNRGVCAICMDCTDLMQTSKLDKLVWCKAQCGRSIHKSCWDKNVEFLKSNRQPLRCVHWYVSTSFVILCGIY